MVNNSISKNSFVHFLTNPISHLNRKKKKKTVRKRRELNLDNAAQLLIT
jgi:hypothetical protein